jgi:hypothetical protein
MAYRGWTGIACKLLIRKRCRDFFDDAHLLDFGPSYTKDCWNEVLVKYVREDLTALFNGEPDVEEFSVEAAEGQGEPEFHTGSSNSTRPPTASVTFAEDTRK